MAKNTNANVPTPTAKPKTTEELLKEIMGSKIEPGDIFTTPSKLGRDLLGVKFDLVGAKIEKGIDGDSVQLTVAVDGQNVTASISPSINNLKAVAFFQQNPKGSIKNATLDKSGREYYLTPWKPVSEQTAA